MLILAATRTNDRPYEKLYFSIVRKEAGRSSKELFVISWQRTVNDEEAHWYGGNIELRLDGLEDITEAATTIKKIAGRLSEGYNSIPNDPQEVLSQLRKMKIKEMVYDPRLSEYVTREELKPETFERWLDDYKAYGQRYCTYDCLAESEEHARKLIAKQFAAHLSEEYPRWGIEEKYADWIKAGKPIFVSTTWNNGKPIDGRPIDEIIALPEVESITAEFFAEVVN